MPERTSSRVGSFSPPTIAYGAPPAVIAPSDNVVEPTAAQAEADALAEAIQMLYEQIANALRDPNAGSATLPYVPKP